jgi:hypothetical protein
MVLSRKTKLCRWFVVATGAGAQMDTNKTRRALDQLTPCHPILGNTTSLYKSMSRRTEVQIPFTFISEPTSAVAARFLLRNPGSTPHIQNLFPGLSIDWRFTVCEYLYLASRSVLFFVQGRE